MAWSAAARAAAAEARRMHKNSKGTPAYLTPYNHKGGSKGSGTHAFSLKIFKGATHTVFMRGKYSDVKTRAIQLAKRVASRHKSTVSVAHLG